MTFLSHKTRYQSTVGAYLFDLSLQLLVEVPEVPHGELILCAHHDPLHVDLVWQEFVFFSQILAFLWKDYIIGDMRCIRRRDSFQRTQKMMACTRLTLRGRPFVKDSSDMMTTCMDVQLCGIVFFTFIKVLYPFFFLDSTPTITFTILGYIVFRWTFELTAKLNYWASPFTADIGNSSLSPQWAALLRCMFYFWFYRMSFIRRRTRPSVYGTVADQTLFFLT